MDWGDSLKRIRRLLRDPDGLIWADAELLGYFNEAALEVALKTGPIMRVETYNFPPEFDGSFMHDWEEDYGEGTQYQCLTVNQPDGFIICFPWEAAYWLDTAPTADDGYRDTHPWEMVLGSTADVVPVPLHGKFSKMRLAVYDEEPIDPIHEKTLAEQDGYYRSRVGQPANYYLLDEQRNLLVLYPRPEVTWDETEIYEVVADDGGMNLSEAWLDDRDTGLNTDIISTVDTLLCVYDAMPEPVQEYQDEIDMAPYLVKYIEYASLERAYGADSDGFIPSLRDYWGLRKKAGLEAVKRWKRKALLNREHRLGGAMQRIRGRHPRLPEHYPAVT